METCYLFYAGRRLVNGKIVYTYARKEKLTSLLTTRNPIMQCPIGGLLSVLEGEDSFKGPYELVGALRDENQVTAWAVEDKAAYQKQQSTQQWKKLAERQDCYDAIITKLQGIIDTLPANQRRAFVYRLIADLRFKK